MFLRGREKPEITSDRRLCVKAHERGCWAVPAELHQHSVPATGAGMLIKHSYGFGARNQFTNL